MPSRYKIKGLAGVTNLDLAIGDTTHEFTVSFFPEEPLVGENVRVQIDGNGPYNEVLDTKDIWIQSDIGEAGYTFESIPSAFAQASETPEIAPGRDWCTAYPTAGTKTVTIESNTWSSGLNTQQFTIPVRDPDTVSWDAVYYIDLNGDSTGMPAEDGTVVHVLDSASFLALSGLGAFGEMVRLRFRRGVEHAVTITSAGDAIACNADHTYIDTFGTGAQPVIKVLAGSFISSFYLFTNGRDETKITGYDFEVDGGYDPVNGLFTQADTTLCFTVLRTDCVQSWYKVTGRGLDVFARASNDEFSRNTILMTDCAGVDNHNFQLCFASGMRAALFRGCFASMPLNTPRGDGKPDTQENMVDHGSIRVQDHEFIAASQCVCRSLGGWSGWGGYDRAIQPFIRAYTDQLTAGMTSRISILWNKTQARVLCGLGGSTAEALPMQQIAPNTLIVGNSCDLPGQGTYMIDSNKGGGVTAYSNICFVPDIVSGQVNYNTYIFRQYARYLAGGGDEVSVASWQAPNYIGFNTLVSDLTENEFSSAPLSTMSNSLLSDNDDDTIVITEEHNILSGDDYLNAGSLTPTSELSRGDDFRPISGQYSGSSPVQGPPISFDRVRAGYTPIEGAHSATGADASVVAPAWSADVVIGELTGVGDGFHDNLLYVLDISGLTGEEYMALGYEWLINGSFVADTNDRRSVAPVIDMSGYVSGTTLQLRAVVSNRSGVVATRLSNIITVS